MVTGSEVAPVAVAEEVAVGAAVMESVAAVVVVDPLPLPLPLPTVVELSSVDEEDEDVVAVAVVDGPAGCDGAVPTSVCVELDKSVELDSDELGAGVGETVSVKVTKGVDDATASLEEDEPPGMAGVLDGTDVPGTTGVLEATALLEETGLLEAEVPGTTGVLEATGVLEGTALLDGDGVSETAGVLEGTALLDGEGVVTGVLDGIALEEVTGGLGSQCKRISFMWSA